MNFISSETGHARPFYYYIPILLGGFFPWSFFLPLALVRGLWGRLKEVDERTLFLVLWFGAMFLFFSVASSKRGTYILPLFPAASILVGIIWKDLLSAPTPELRKGFFYSYVPIVVIFPLLWVYFWINPPARLESRYGIDLIRIYFLGFTFVFMAAISFFMCVRKHYKAFFSINVGLMVAGTILFIVLIVPLINPYRSTKGLAQKLDVMVPPGQEFVFYGDMRDSALFYTNRRALVFRVPEQLIHYLGSNNRAFCIIEKKHFETLDKVKAISNVVDQEGRDLIIAKKTSAY